MIYDKACQLWRTIMAMGEENPENLRYLLDGHLLVVDRFHSKNHAPHDIICMDHCNPFDPKTPGMVRVISRVPVLDGGDDRALLTGHGVSFHVNINAGIEGAPVKLVKRRRVRKRVRAGAGLLQAIRWFEYVLEDDGDTEVAEQTFSRLRKYKGVMRNMRMWHAMFYLNIMIEHANHDIHCKLVRTGKNPRGANEAAFAAKCRSKSNYRKTQFWGSRATSWVDEAE
mmetsp:Transcript_31930/g.51123  ORF Transcript_31930/g.51123 Transcript_31930/m.51123 type:complete len:226 (-) Transcript_31930:149-826(-)